MRNFLMAAIVALALAPPAARAQHDHGHDGHATASTQMLAASTPSDGSELTVAPRTLALTFAHPVMLQTVAITGPDGAPVAATFRRQSTPTTAYSVALPALASGAYEARWTATGAGHTMNGVVRFSVR